MFAQLIRKTMEVYMDDMLTKSIKAEDHVKDLKETFDMLRKYQMKQNLVKYAFKVISRKFLDS